MLRYRGNTIPRYSRAVIIYNPHSGQLKKGRAHRLVRAAEALKGLAHDVSLTSTNGPRTAGQLAKTAIDEGADLIVAAGGDGTISEVANGMVHSQVPLGILPAGTANVLANETGLKRSVVAAARQMHDCVPSRISVGLVNFSEGNNWYFLLMLGAGFDAQIIYELSAGLKEKLGKLSYFLGGIGRLGRQLAELEVRGKDGEWRRCTFALVSKVRNYGGDFEIAGRVRLTDDFFEVVLFQGKNSWRYLRYLAAVATRSVAGTSGVNSFDTDCLELRAVEPGVRVQADGEFLGTPPARVRMVPDALTVLLPENTGR